MADASDKPNKGTLKFMGSRSISTLGYGSEPPGGASCLDVHFQIVQDTRTAPTVAGYLQSIDVLLGHIGNLCAEHNKAQ